MPSMTPRPTSAIKYLVVHNTAGSRTEKTESIRADHMAPVSQGGRGFADIGYNRVIEGNGSVHMGRRDDVVPAHAEGFNTQSLGVSLCGNFDRDAIDTTHPQYKTLVQVAATLCRTYRIPVERIIGHRDVYPLLGQPVAKSCPGNHLYALLPQLRKDVARYLA